MSSKREKKLWDEIGWLRFLLAVVVTLILGIAYFAIWQWSTSIWREFLLSIVANLIPIPLVFILAYIVFRRIEEIRLERDSDELADKVVLRLLEIAKVQADSTGNSSTFLDDFPEISESYLKLSRELDITVKPFEAKSSPQKLVIECLYRGRNIIRIKKVSYSGSKLGISDLAKEYKLDDNGHRAVIPHEKHEIVSGEKFSIQLSLAKKWNKETIEGWFGKLGYLHFEVEDNNITEDLPKAI